MKKIITILLIIPILFHNIGISDVSAGEIVENKVISRNLNSEGVPYEDFIYVHKNLRDGYLAFISGFGAQFIPGVGISFNSAAYAANVRMFLSFLQYTDKALGTSYNSLDTSMENMLYTSMGYNFKFLKEPDNISCKVKYSAFENEVIYEKFKTKKYMYALNINSTKVYKYATTVNNKVLGNYNFGNDKIEVYGIVNGFADTNKGFIKVDDLTSTKPLSVSSIKLNATSITLKNVRSYKLIATINPTNATNKNVTWSSSNTKVATVDANGNVSAVGAGTATIAAKSNNGKTATCKVTVSNPSSVAVSSIKLNSTSITLQNVRNYKLTATINPTNATNKNVTWTSSNTRVATVDANGNVKAVGAGTATITAKSNNGKTATCKVTVSNPSSVAVSSIKLNSTSITLQNVRNYKLTATINPTNATNKNVTWTSSNTRVATVDANGNVKAVGAGTATITAKSNNGKTATCKVTVINPYAKRTVKFTVNLPNSFKQKHYVEILNENNGVEYTSAAKTGSSIYNFTYQLDQSSSSYTRRIRIRTVSGNKIYNSELFKINSSTINKNVTATFAAGTSGTTTNSLKTGKITQK